MCAVDNVDTIVTLAETYYQAPDALGTKVTFFVTEINHARTEMRLEGGDFGTYIPVYAKIIISHNDISNQIIWGRLLKN